MAAKRSGAGSLSELVVFQVQEEVDDGFGGVSGQWVDKFTEPARMAPRLGSETVIASRLQGVQPFLLTVRSSSRSRLVTPAWRVYDKRAGVTAGKPNRLFNIKTAVNVDERNGFLEMLIVDNGGA